MIGMNPRRIKVGETKGTSIQAIQKGVRFCDCPKRFMKLDDIDSIIINTTLGQRRDTLSCELCR